MSRCMMPRRAVLPLALIAIILASFASAQSSGDLPVQSTSKSGVHRDLSANEARMAATSQDKVQIVAAIARTNALLARASPAVRIWVRDEGRRQAQRIHTYRSVQEAAQMRFGNDLSTADIDALIQLVMMESARNAEQELRDELAQMQAINRQKRAQREAAQKMHGNQSDMRASMQAEAVHGLPRTFRAELAAYVARASDGKDSLDDMSEEQQLKMQMAMDRMQKALEMMSNLMKKQSEAQDTIIGNLK